MKRNRLGPKEKSFLHHLWVLFFIMHFFLLGHSQNVAVNNTGALPAASAMLDVSSSNRGVLLPRLTTAQRKAIANPAVGLLVFDIDKFSLYVFDGQGWMALSVQKDADLLPVSRTATDPSNDKNFGFSIAISGDYAIIGAYGDTAAKGAAYIFFRSASNWIMQEKLIADDGVFNDFFGYSVDISGDYAIVGAYNKPVGGNFGQGAAYVFFRNGTTWSQQAKIIASDGAANVNFGISVGISGDYAIVGAHQDLIGANIWQGSAYVFVRSGTSWAQQQKVIASDGAAGDNFGFDVAISGDFAIVGAYNHDVGVNANQGAAYIFVRSGNVWTQQPTLTCSDAGVSKFFGYSVSISGNYAVMGAYGDLSNQGSAYVFFKSGANYLQQQKITAFDGAASDNFGFNVAISGDYILIGSPNDDISFTNQGSAYLFKKNINQWPLVRKIAEFNGNTNFNFGKAVSISLLNLIIGSPQNNNSGFSNSGSVSFLNLE